MNLNSLNEFRIHIGRVISIKEVMKDGVFPPSFHISICMDMVML